MARTVRCWLSDSCQPVARANRQNWGVLSLPTGHYFGTSGIWLDRRAGNVFHNDILCAGWFLSLTYNPSSDAYSFTERQQFLAICRTSRCVTILIVRRSEPKESNPPALISCVISILITSHLHLVFPRRFLPFKVCSWRFQCISHISHQRPIHPDVTVTEK